MANETTYTTLTELAYAAIIEREAMDTLVATIILPKFVRQDSLVGDNSVARSYPKYPSLTAAAVNEATDLTNTAVETTENTVTAGENGWMTTLTDVARLSTNGDSIKEIGRLAGEAMARKIDSDIFALLDNLNSDSAVGTSGSDLTIAQVESAVASCRINNAKPPYVFVCHPRQASDLRSAITASTGTPFANTTPSSLVSDTLGYEYTFEGIDVYSSTLSPTANAAADQVGAVMSIGRNSPIAMVTKWSTKVELERNASLRASEIVCTADYGVGEIENLGGVPVITDA